MTVYIHCLTHCNNRGLGAFISSRASIFQEIRNASIIQAWSLCFIGLIASFLYTKVKYWYRRCTDECWFFSLCLTNRMSLSFDRKCQTKEESFCYDKASSGVWQKNSFDVHASRCLQHLLSWTKVYNGRISGKKSWRLRRIVIFFSLVPALLSELNVVQEACKQLEDANGVSRNLRDN